MQSNSCVACYYVRTCPQSARTTAWMKNRSARPKERQVCSGCMSWLLRDGLAEECEPSHVRTPCSTLGLAAQQQLVQLVPACNRKGSATDGGHRPSEAVVCPSSVLDGQSCEMPLVGVESSALQRSKEPCYYAGNDNFPACLQHVECGARTVAWMKGRSARRKERPVCDVCMSWLLRGGLAEEREPSHLPMPCSTRGPTANRQPVAEALRTPCSTLGPAACYYAGNDNITACLQHVGCGARTVAWMKGKTSSPKERPVCDVCMSWLLRDGLAEEREPSHVWMPCSTLGPTAKQQPVADAGGGCPLPRSHATLSPIPKRGLETVGGDIALESQPSEKWCSVSWQRERRWAASSCVSDWIGIVVLPCKGLCVPACVHSSSPLCVPRGSEHAADDGPTTWV